MQVTAGWRRLACHTNTDRKGLLEPVTSVSGWYDVNRLVIGLSHGGSGDGSGDPRSCKNVHITRDLQNSFHTIPGVVPGASPERPCTVDLQGPLRHRSGDAPGIPM
jgi:hypothetical protein